MALQNRVTPFGDIVAIPQRGLFTGNRGIIHDPATKTLLRKRWSSKAWIICTCSFKDVRRDVMSTRSWTELFFLDEAVALAAGHRPCFACRRESANAFRSAWSAFERDSSVSILWICPSRRFPTGPSWQSPARHLPWRRVWLFAGPKTAMHPP